MELFREDGCLSDEGLHALTAGQLDELGRLEAAEHLAYCDKCTDRYTALLTADALADPPRDVRRTVMSTIWVRLMQSTCGRAAVAGVAAVLALTMWRTGALTFVTDHGSDLQALLPTVQVTLPEKQPPTEGEAFGKKGNDVFRKIETFPIPVIAAVNGFALGGGCEISMSCDIRICSDNAVFGQPEVGLGITPGFGGTQRLARLVGAGMAKQMIYTARNIKAADAYRIGLVNEVYSAEVDADGNVVKSAQEVMLAAAQKLAATIAKNAPIAVRNCKKAINEGLDADMDQAVVIEEKLFGDCFETEDQKYGMAFFLDKNKEKVKEPFKNC